MSAEVVSKAEYDWMVGDRDGWNQRSQLLSAENCRLVDDLNAAKKERGAALAELEGLRADALANAPQRIDLQQYANLKAEHELQVTIIETLQEALKRTESMLSAAQAKQIDQRLQGFLSVIEQLSSQVQEMLP